MSAKQGKAVILALMGVAWILWGLEQERALASHNLMWGQDLAFFNQIFYSASQGGDWTSPLLLEPTGFFKMVHFHPIIGLLLPFYALRPEPSTLLWLNAGAVVAATWPIARLGARATKCEIVGVAAALAWLCWLPTRSAAIADFRPMVFWIPGLAWLIWGVYCQKAHRWIIGLLLCCFAREESGYLIPTIGLLLIAGLPLGGKRRKEGLWIAGAGLFWLCFLLIFKENFFFHFNPANMINGDGGASPGDALQSSRTDFLLSCIQGGYLSSVLAPGVLAFGAGPLHWLMTDAQREWHAFSGTVVYLKNPLLPLIACSGTLGMAWLINRYPRGLPVFCLWMVLGNYFSFSDARDTLNQRNNDNVAQQQQTAHKSLSTLLSKVGSKDRVATDSELIAALSGRDVLWNVDHLYNADKPHHWKGQWPLTLVLFDTLVLKNTPREDEWLYKLQNNPEHHIFQAEFTGANWRVAFRSDTYTLWRRTTSSNPTIDQTPPPKESPEKPTK